MFKCNGKIDLLVEVCLHTTVMGGDMPPFSLMVRTFLRLTLFAQKCISPVPTLLWSLPSSCSVTSFFFWYYSMLIYPNSCRKNEPKDPELQLDNYYTHFHLHILFLFNVAVFFRHSVSVRQSCMTVSLPLILSGLSANNSSTFPSSGNLASERNTNKQNQTAAK